jgi:uncharacterized repeat protein (TIGR03803 family)
MLNPLMRNRLARRARAALAGTLTVSLALSASAGRSSASESVLYSFVGGSDGSGPMAGLIVDRSGVLYGTTRYGGGSGCTSNEGCGTVFSLTPPTVAGGVWSEAVLHSFLSGADGASPMAGLLAGKSGVLYGTTESGGASNAGTVFELTPPATPGGAWTENILYSFSGGIDGSQPVAALIAESGTLYGTTEAGGAAGLGTVFALTPPAIAGGL